MKLISVFSHLIAITCVCLSCLGIEDSPRLLQLKNTESGFVVVEFVKDAAYFHDPTLREEMEKKGIAVPLEKREKYGGKEHIFLGDRQFLEAFQELYYPYQFDPETHSW
jgi:hypothetical protein